MSSANKTSLLSSCLLVKGPKRELSIASLGCLLGTVLLLLSFQFYQDAVSYLSDNQGPMDYFTINKKVEGGALANLGKREDSFSPEEMEAIKKLDGVKRVGGFVRNQFPVTVYIWPTGTVGLGSAAKADLFFESIPDEFLDFVPEEWTWEENSSLVPIMVPKFYLDLWNFGLAPSRIEYPPLSVEAATGMPIEVFIGKSREATLDGRFVAFSKRINSVLVPEAFLAWANRKFGQPDAGDFFFLWKNGVIEGPPHSRDELGEFLEDPDFGSWEVSPLENPAQRAPAISVLEKRKESLRPSRIILEISEKPSQSLLRHIDENGYEMNREFPEQDKIRQVTRALLLGMTGVGGLLSLLSIATFATSFRLMIAQMAQHASNLILLGFSRHEVSRVFLSRFNKLFLLILLASVGLGYGVKQFLVAEASRFNVVVEGGFSAQSMLALLIYAIGFLVINKRVIDKSIRELSQ